MNDYGIPPSPERQQFAQYTVLLIGGAVLFLIGGLALMVYYGNAPSTPLLDNESTAPVHRYSSEDEERASAFAAVQIYLLQRINTSEALEVTWTDTQHEGHRGWYRFEGLVTMRFENNESRRFNYLIAVQSASQGGWELKSLEYHHSTPTPSVP